VSLLQKPAYRTLHIPTILRESEFCVVYREAHIYQLGYLTVLRRLRGGDMISDGCRCGSFPLG
jgi:hypothetical protein